MAQLSRLPVRQTKTVGPNMNLLLAIVSQAVKCQKILTESQYWFGDHTWNLRKLWNLCCYHSKNWFHRSIRRWFLQFIGFQIQRFSMYNKPLFWGYKEAMKLETVHVLSISGETKNVYINQKKHNEFLSSSEDQVRSEVYRFPTLYTPCWKSKIF